MDRALSLQDYATSDLSDELRNYFVSEFAGIPWREAERRPSEAVEQAYAVLQREYAVVGIVEALDAVMARIRQTANIEEPFPNVAHNETQGRPTSDEVDEAALAAIRERNALDIELYERIRRQQYVT
jgi:hypothetical protein